ncbi:MAG: flagellar brake domain-containing protein [Nitrospinae bacterium]|nr:flagellar brake domain-containing protein [Nitrospinota bacterium]
MKLKDYFSRIKAIKSVMNNLTQERENKILTHLNKVCSKNKPLELSLENSFLTYKSMFVSAIDGVESQGILIDTMMPIEGDARLKPGTDVHISYNYGMSRYKFDTKVKSKVMVQFPAYYLELPQNIISADKRYDYRLPTKKSKPILIDRSGDRILSSLLSKSMIKNFTNDGICIYIPPVTQITEGLNFLSELFSRFFLRLPDSTLTNPIKASCRYIKPAYSSNGYVCGLRFDDINHWDKTKLMNMYDDRKRELRLA